MPLRGTCNSCGQCCIIKTEKGEPLRCLNLIVIGKLGDPMATACAIYPVRKPQEPILLLDDKGVIRGHTTCANDGSVDEFNSYAPYIGKGCSLELVER